MQDDKLPVIYDENDEQRKAITAPQGLVQCVAGPGSGKTKTVVYKIAYEIQHRNKSPSSIIALTFTRKAAKEMKDRLAKFIGKEQAALVTMGTIHSFCYHTIRKNYELFKLKSPDICIVDDYNEVLTPILKEDNDKAHIAYLDSHFSECFANDTPIEDDAQEAFKKMREYQYKNNIFTFDDLIYLLYKKMKDSEVFRKLLASQYSLVIVDESQDNIRTQTDIAKMLASVSGNLFMVGDDAQSIYKFRNADIDTFLDYSKQAQVFKLENNYRSTAEIVKLGETIIKYNNADCQVPKTLKSIRGSGIKPDMRIFNSVINYSKEIGYICNLIETAEKKYKKEQIAVLCRSVRDSFARELQTVLIMRRIPFVVYGGDDISKSKHLRIMFSGFNVALGNNHLLDWERLLTTIPRIGKVTVERMLNGSIDRDSILKKTPDKSGVYVEKLFDALDAINKNRDNPVVCIFYFKEWYKFCLHGQDIVKATKVMDSVSSSIAMMEGDLSEVVANYQIAREDKEETVKDKIIVSTVHAAKGLEWDCVIVPNLCDAGIPWVLATSRAEFQEECRILHVAVTRAKTELHLSASLKTDYYDGVLNSDLADEGVDVRKVNLNKQRYSKLSRFLNHSEVMDCINTTVF